jgi:hypothetical protein
LKWFRLSAAQGNANAQYNIGIGYSAHGHPETAIEWFHLAAKQGCARAQFKMGQMYDEGYGVAEDDRKAEEWYLLATEQGDSRAQYRLGSLYAEHGYPDHAKNYLELAAQQGMAAAIEKLRTLAPATGPQNPPLQLGVNVSAMPVDVGQMLYGTTGPDTDGNTTRIRPDYSGGYRATDSDGNTTRIRPD